MHDKEKKTIGILGGMGPEATAFMFNLFIEEAKTEKDQDHPKIIIFSNPEIPPRTDAIFKQGENPVPHLIRGISLLQNAGADIIVIACVTAHYFIQDVMKEKDFRFISLLDEAVKWVKTNFPGLQKAGLLSSSGTIKSGIFHNIFEKKGIQLINPDENEQKIIMDAIFGKRGIKAGYKTGNSRQSIVRAAISLINKGAEAVIAGCTEIPLVLKAEDINVPYIEPMHITVTAALKEAGYSTR